jgi:hypothetical protein
MLAYAASGLWKSTYRRATADAYSLVMVRGPGLRILS